jgi:hypothetical protein
LLLHYRQRHGSIVGGKPLREQDNAYLFILTTYLAAKKNFWSDVGEDPGSDPAVATEINRTLSLLPLDIPRED